MVVAFTGDYGMRNFGDDLSAALCAAACRHFWNATPLLVAPPIPGAESATTLSHRYPRERYAAPGALGKATRLYSLVHALARADVLVMGGGSVISHDSTRKGMMRMVRRARGLRLAAMGVSIGPFHDAEDAAAAARFMQRLDYLTVRDDRSFRTAASMGFETTTHNGRDIGGLLPLFGHARRAPDAGTPGTLRIGIAPCEYAEAATGAMPGKDETLAALRAALRRRARDVPLRADVFSLNEHPVHGDGARADRLHAQLRESGVPGRRIRYGADGSGPVAFAAEIAGCDAFVSTRLHGAVAAYMQDVPVTLIEYHPKCRDFADDVGLPPARRIHPGRNGMDAFEEALSSMLDTHAHPALAPHRYALGAAAMFRHAPWSRPWEDVPAMPAAAHGSRTSPPSA